MRLKALFPPLLQQLGGKPCLLEGSCPFLERSLELNDVELQILSQVWQPHHRVAVGGGARKEGEGASRRGNEGSVTGGARGDWVEPERHDREDGN